MWRDNKIILMLSYLIICKVPWWRHDHTKCGMLREVSRNHLQLRHSNSLLRRVSNQRFQVYSIMLPLITSSCSHDTMLYTDRFRPPVIGMGKPWYEAHTYSTCTVIGMGKPWYEDYTYSTCTVIGMGKPWYRPFSIFTNKIEISIRHSL